MKLISLFLVITISYPVFSDCTSPQTQQEMNRCEWKSFKKADKLLNITYQKLREIKKSDKQYLKNLTLSQRAWILFRDAEIKTIFSCKYKDPSQCFGSMYDMSNYQARKEMTLKRIESLKQYIKEFE